MITGSLAKSLGVNNGGFAVGKEDLIDYLRQKHRTYLFSNALGTCTTAGAKEALELIIRREHQHEKLVGNMEYFRNCLN